MREPYIYINVFDDALHVGKKLPTESAPREIFDVSLSEVCSDGLEEASKKLGGTVLGILKLWHEEALSGMSNRTGWQGKPDAEAAFEVALFLIDRFSSGAPEFQLKLIDEILADAAISDSVAKEYLENDWPALRRRLLRTA